MCATVMFMPLYLVIFSHRPKLGIRFRLGGRWRALIQFHCLRSCPVILAEVPLLDVVRSGKPLEELFKEIIVCKPEHHNMLAAIPVDLQRRMSQLG